MKRVFGVFLLLSALLLCGCGERVLPQELSTPAPRTEEEPAEPENTQGQEALVDTRPAEIRILSAYPAGPDSDCFAEVYESLYALSGEKYVPILAEGKAIRGSGESEYLIPLRKNVCDSEGQSFGAAEAAECYLRYAEERGDKLLLTAEATEEGGLRLHFSRELRDFEEAHWLCAVPMYGTKTDGDADEAGAVRYLGTGPYVISEQSRDELLLVPNGLYGGEPGKQNVQSIRYLFIEDAPSQVIALETGRADMANGLSYEDAEDFLPGGSYSDLFTTAEYYSSIGRFLLPNVGKGSALESEEKRLALFGAIDCAALAERIGGQACTALGNPDCAELTESFQSYQTQSTEGWASPALRLTLLCPQSGAGKLCADALAAQLEGKGYSLFLRPLSAEEYASALDSGEGWDLAVVETPTSRSAVEHWKALWNYAANAASLRGGQTDATLINLLQTIAEGRDTAGDCVHRFQERVYNHGLALALPRLNEPRVLPLWVTEAVLNQNGAILPGECAYEG